MLGVSRIFLVVLKMVIRIISLVVFRIERERIISPSTLGVRHIFNRLSYSSMYKATRGMSKLNNYVLTISHASHR